MCLSKLGDKGQKCPAKLAMQTMEDPFGMTVANVSMMSAVPRRLTLYNFFPVAVVGERPAV
jgi:hypothetical protein